MRTLRFPSPLRFAAALLLGAAAVRVHAQAGDLQQFSTLTDGYNLISFGNAQLNFSSQDVEGPVAVGGSLTLGGDPLVSLSQFGNFNDPTLYVGGAFSIENGQTVQLENGYAALPGQPVASSPNYPYQGQTNRYQPPGTTGWLEVDSNGAHSNTNPTTNPVGSWATTSMSTVQTDLTRVSNDLAGDAATGSISVSNQALTFTGAASGITVFDLHLNQAGGLTVSNGTDFYNGQSFSSIAMGPNGQGIGSGAVYVVNVFNAGSDPNTIFGQPNFNLGSGQASQLLWNLVGTGSATLGDGGQFFGSVLAPQMTIANGTNDPLTGQIVANQVNYQNAELHYAALVAVPEPATGAAGMAAAALALALAAPLARRCRTVS